jgi:palmitoyltransferase
MTPLHLAVMSGNGRIVRRLLLKGCNRNIKSKSEKLPLDIARDNDYKNIVDMIEDKEGIEEWMGIKTPFRKLKKHTFPFYLLVFLFTSVYCLNAVFFV